MQLRDDLLSMLVAGHETTGSVLTWTVDLLAKNPEKLKKVCVDGWVGGCPAVGGFKDGLVGLVGVCVSEWVAECVGWVGAQQ